MPGYIMHLAQGQIILEQLENTHHFYLPKGWKEQFLLGCLLPDTGVSEEKMSTHYRDPELIMNLKQYPRPQVFTELYGEYREDPRVLGCMAHLDLDLQYLEKIWDRHMTFVDGAGREQDHRSEIQYVLLDGIADPVPIRKFLSGEGLYGDYTKLNGRIMEEYIRIIPEYSEADWADCPVREVFPERLPHILMEIRNLIHRIKPEESDEVRYLSYEWIQKLLQESAEEAALRIAGILEELPESGPVDLHAHTFCSDGSLSPTELIQLAMRRRMKAIAVTDHDTMEGIPEAVEAGRRLGVEVIPGIEFSTKEEGKSVHMVGLFLDPENAALKETLETIVKNRWIRNQKMIQKLMDAGTGITWEMTKKLGDGIWTRANIAGLLMETGAVESVKDAFDRYLSPGCVGYVPKIPVAPQEVIELTHKAGGLIFVAHYYQIDKKDLANSYRICEKILQQGADGLETIYSVYDDEMKCQTEELAVRYGCLRSGGSDYHGKLKPGLELGYGYGSLYVPEDFLDRMKARLDSGTPEA